MDAFALIYRAHFAFISRPLINSKGQNTSAITGFTRTLWDLLKKEQPTHLAVAFDRPEPTFRHEVYPDYKANREAQPEDITWSIPYIRNILEAFNIPILEEAGMEADDIIGTIANRASEEGYEVFMVTPDKDYGQLVNDNIKMYKPSRKGEGIDVMGVPEILEKWDVASPSQVIDMLGLQGDSSDNIPGVKGIGVKTAAKLLKQYQNIENLYDHIEELKGSVKTKLETQKDEALMSKFLATIKTDCNVAFEPEKLKIGGLDKERLNEIFNDLEFRTLKRDILGQKQEESPVPTLFDLPPKSKPQENVVVEIPKLAGNHIGNTPHEYILLESDQQIDEFVKEFAKSDHFCFDTETTHIDATKADLVGIAFSKESGKAYYLPCPEDYNECKKLLDKFNPLWDNAEIAKIGQNLKYDLIIMLNYGIDVKGRIYDTMIIHYLMEPSLRHNMDYLAESYLSYSPVSIETLIGKKSSKQAQLSMRDVPLEKIVDYASEDADITYQLYEKLLPQLQKNEGLWNLYLEVEEPLIKVLAQMEHEGINLDVEFLKEYSVEVKEKIVISEKKIYEMAGSRFNIASPKQVGEILFGRLEIPYRWKKTKSGQYSTSEEKLTELSVHHEIIDQILTHRSLKKLLGTYIDPLPLMVNERTDRLHSNFNQALAATGRLSSNNPNIQNIPIRTKEGRKIRRAFVPRDKDHVIVAADYSQIELRVIASISGDERMIEAFREGVDIHTATAASVYNVAIDDVNADQRRNAKTVNFSIIYGAGATNLSRQLNIPRKEATELINQYFAQYQGIKQYMTNMVEFAQKQGFVQTLKGRRRDLRDINSKSSLERSNAERVAINTPIQGTAADMIKIAMKRVDDRIKQDGLEGVLIMQVHDELVFDVPKNEVEQFSKMVKEEMQAAMPEIKVPIIVEVGVGEDWLEAH